MKKFMLIFLSILIITFFVSGCAQSTPATSSKVSLTQENAAKIVLNDLNFHGEQVAKLTITGISISADGKSAIVDVTYMTKAGIEKKARPTLIRSANAWEISGHKH